MTAITWCGVLAVGAPVVGLGLDALADAGVVPHGFEKLPVTLGCLSVALAAIAALLQTVKWSLAKNKESFEKQLSDARLEYRTASDNLTKIASSLGSLQQSTQDHADRSKEVGIVLNEVAMDVKIIRARAEGK